jgi:hypothetical protein
MLLFLKIFLQVLLQILQYINMKYLLLLNVIVPQKKGIRRSKQLCCITRTDLKPRFGLGSSCANFRSNPLQNCCPTSSRALKKFRRLQQRIIVRCISCCNKSVLIAITRYVRIRLFVVVRFKNGDCCQNKYVSSIDDA